MFAKLILPGGKKHFIFAGDVTVFSTNWQKLANPGRN
jgi:hypothetical protein